MELKTFVLFCTLFSSIAAFTLEHGLTPSENDDILALFSPNNDACRCKNGRCVKDNKGKTKCNCKKGYALQDENTCEECDCGSKGKCIFVGLSRSTGGYAYVKKCLCDLGSAEKDGVCVDCNCGEKSKCEFEDGEKNCYCIEGYAEKDGVCTKCDCGEDGECTFKNGQKICTCDEDYEDINGYCKHKCDRYECKNGGTCHSENGMPVCKCLERFSGTHCEIDKCDALNCRNGGKCKLFNGIALCKCPDRYKGKDCEIDKCDALNCQNGGKCKIVNGNAVCECPERFTGKDCETDKCSFLNCQNGYKCAIQNSKAICDCNLQVVPKYTGENCEKATCSDHYPCHNGGDCGDRSCNCRPGTSGGFCDVIDECPDLCPKRSDINCTYDIKSERAHCDCLGVNMGFDPERQDCKRTCNPSQCKNGGECKYEEMGLSRFCRCLDGTDGDFCENIPGCRNLNCGTEASCQYDVSRKAAACQCRDNGLVFDPTDRTCKKPCRESKDCLNGGTCVKTGPLGYCDCLDGTKGAHCEEVPGCINKECGHNAKCEFDVGRRIAMCKCIDANFEFDPIDFKCKKQCRDSSDCKNGGSCSGIESNKFCRCLNGTIGDFCEDVPVCNNKDCGRDAKCVFDVARKSASCKCFDNNLAFDELGKVCKRTCKDNDNCKNGGRCMARVNNWFCHCLEGTSGDYCENVTICNKKCGNNPGVFCKYDFTQKIAECQCKDEKYEFDVATKSCKKCDCGGKETSCYVRDGKKTCNCPHGYADVNGICKKQICTDRKCIDGNCEVVNDQEVCTCYEGFYLDGDECKRKECTKVRCFNGTCVVRNGGFETCVCPAGYTLRAGVCIKGTCKMTTCFGGQCKIIDGELTCKCPERYDLEGVGCFETVCKIKRCFGGKCVVKKTKGQPDEEICTCHEGYKLVNDVCKLVLCEKKNCFGGQCFIRNGTETCECPAGHSIVKDVCVRKSTDICEDVKVNCKKTGGTYDVTLDNEILCICPEGFEYEKGVGCQSEVQQL